ncbi:hypothetical protein [Anaerocolumna sp. MB42-C2]|uniref:hypothetical protein n=1 Tax=Anaerocolumna sp. MB42-C2 TaxID=3070997 RepID=UPI0027DFBFA6|nr:hypothetical protein [Anaerocolumna sp. MB42-C2]WMJ86409.1 hypothetical protein RBU59_20530 [Anaerocolumna sp. MB42-C2]
MAIMKSRVIYFKMFLLLFLVAFPVTVNADMGPKPQITVIVKNPPEGEYYLDLLVKGECSYENLRMDEASCDRNKLALLESYNTDGWHPGLTKGTRIPMHGKLTGVKESDVMIHTFSYVGVPDDFKIIIITPKNQYLVSQEIHRDRFHYTVYYDYNTGEITTEKIAFSYIREFLLTCLPTLLIEGIVLLLFGFSLRKNLKPFLIINVLTQIFLTTSVGWMIQKEGHLSGYFILIPIEIIIFLVEMLAFSLLLKEYSKARRVIYAFTANLLSFLAGIFLLLWA